MNKYLIAITLLLISNSVISENSRTEAFSLPSFLKYFSEKNKMQLLVDPRVKAYVNIYEKEKEDITLSDLHVILDVHGYALIKMGNLNVVLPKGNARQSALIINNNNSGIKFHSSEMVTTFINIKYISASHLVPMLRPLMPQMGHLGVSLSDKKIILTDSYENTQRIIKIIKWLDTKEDAKLEKLIIEKKPNK